MDEKLSRKELIRVESMDLTLRSPNTNGMTTGMLVERAKKFETFIVSGEAEDQEESKD